MPVLMELLMKPLATPLNPKVRGKRLVIAIRPGYHPKDFWPGTRKTIAKSLVMSIVEGRSVPNLRKNNFPFLVPAHPA